MSFNAKATNIGVADTQIFECPATQSGSVHGLVISNISGASATVTLQFLDQSEGTTTTIATRALAQGTEFTFPKPINVTAGDKLLASASADNALVAFHSVYLSTASPVSQGFTGRGQWDALATYDVNDVVTWEGSSYLCLSRNTGSMPPSSHWMVLAAPADIPAATASTAGLMAAEDKAKLDGVEEGATGDQTASEILTLLKTVDGAGSGLDADTLDGMQATAFATAVQGARADSAVQPGTLTAGLGGKVDKVAGKGLSTEDYTTADKTKLSGIQAGAQVNPTIVNNLTSTSTTQPLAANQGRVLKGFIDTINSLLASDDTTLDDLQEIVDFIKLNRAELDALSIPSIAGLQAALDGKLGKTATAAAATKLATARSIALTGDVTGSVSFDGTSNVSMTTTVANDSHTHSFANLTSKPTTVSGYGITDAVTTSTAQTITGTKSFAGIIQVDELRRAGGTIQEFTQTYQPTSYLTPGEYLELLTITPTSNSQNFDVFGEIYVQASENVQVLRINVGLRSNTLPDLGWRCVYSQELNGSPEFTKPLLLTKETTTAAFKLALQGLTGSAHNVAYRLTVVNRSGTGYTTKSMTAAGEYTTLPSGYVANDMTRVTTTNLDAVIFTNTVTAPTFSGALSGNAATATKLATARTIGGVSFDGSANISLPGVNAAGNQNTSGNAATATKLQTARTIAGTAFDGTANIAINYNNLTNKPTIPTIPGVATTSSNGLMSSADKTKLNAVGTMANRNVTISTAAADGGANGDVWFRV